MEILYNILHHPPHEWFTLASQIAPEFLPVLRVIPQHKTYYYYVAAQEVEKLFGEDKAMEFVNLHTNDEKYDIISNIEREFPPICLPTQFVIDRLPETRSELEHLQHAVGCGNYELFHYMINKYIINPTVAGAYFRGVSFNPTAINWIQEIYDLSIIKNRFIKDFYVNLRKFPRLIVKAKFVFDFLLRNLDLTPEQLAELALNSAVNSPGQTLQIMNTISVCEILDQTGYFNHRFFISLTDQYQGVRKWLEISDI